MSMSKRLSYGVCQSISCRANPTWIPGFFDDRPAGPFGQYVSVGPTTPSDFKGRQLLAGRGNDFFDKAQRRIFDGETSQTGPQAKKETAGTGGRVMLPPSSSKLHSTPNDWYGCIGKPPDYFSPAVRVTAGKKGLEKAAGDPPNCKIKPNPLGGPGYVDICLNSYPKHIAEPYDLQEDPQKGGKSEGPLIKGKFLTASAPLDFFPPNPYLDPAPGPTYRPPDEDPLKSMKSLGPGRFYVPFPKKPGGQHAGCFSKVTYSSDPYQQTPDTKTPSGPKFIAGGPNYRAKYTNSIINQVTGISCNVKNYRKYQERVYPLSF